MKQYRIELSNQASRILDKIAAKKPHLYRRIAAAIDDLRLNPLQGKPLKGQLRGRYSSRVGTYRIIYAIKHTKLIIYIIDAGHRKDIYK
jgi:mRNA interferase RelE/StbE